MKKIAKGRRTGQDHPNAVLTDGEVEQLRQCREVLGMTYAQISEKMEVPKSTVAKICQYNRR